MKDELQIYIQTTPNPDALKFILNRDVKAEGKATFHRGEDTYDCLLAHDLLNLNHVDQVHLFENVITITKSSLGEWDDVAHTTKAVIETRMPVHNIHFSGKVDESARRKNLSPELQAIEDILDRTIRPGLQGDGGDLDVISYENKVLSIKYQGACGSCPSSTQGTLYAIEDILKREFDPEIQIMPISD